MTTFLDGFHRQLFAKVSEAVSGRMARVAGGECQDWAAYQRDVGYILACNDILGICQEIEKELYGKPESKKDDGA